MFKKAVAYDLKDNTTDTRNLLLESESILEKYKFTEISQTSSLKKSVGFCKTPLGSYVDENNGDIFICVTTQTKSANPYEINEVLKNKVATMKALHLEQQLETGVDASEAETLTIDKKLMKSLKEEATVEVLCTTFAKEPKTTGVLFRKNGQVIIEGNYSSAEQVASLIRKALGSFPIVPFETENELSDLLDSFISEEVNDIVTLGDKAIFATQDGRQATLSGTLYDSEAQDFIKEGMMAEAVEITRDGVISTLLKDTGEYDAIKYSELITEDCEDLVATFLLQVSELCNLVDDINSRLTES